MDLNRKRMTWQVVAACWFCAGIALAGRGFAGGPDAGQNHRSVNKGIDIEHHARVGDVETVNGRIRIDDDSQAEHVSSVNGTIEIGARSQVRSIEAVNGAIGLGAQSVVQNGIESVNGAITARDGAKIGNGVSTVNGALHLQSVTVGGDLETHNGDIHLVDSEIVGDIRIKKSKHSGSRGNKVIRVVIGPGTVVHGDLYLEKRVALTVDADAKTGAIHGDEIEYQNMK